MSELVVRRASDADWPSLWGILAPVFRAGETYAFSPDITEEEARGVWLTAPTETWVAEDAGTILATYYIKPNQPALGAHVCNCGYVVSEQARGRGIARQLCRHSLDQARRLGFRAMQYNLVVATNEAAIAAWQKEGFEVVGRLPGAFAHPRHGDTDALIMYFRL